MPQNITLDDVDALDDVNGSSPYQNDVTERIDIAYDDGGDRLWYSYNKLSDGSGMTRVTLPGVGVYEATKTNGVNGTVKLVRKDLVAGGYRDEAGHAHFPVMDAQGNVRGYATSDGIQSAYDYYAYGTMMDLSPDAGDDNKRWQDKEFDGEHGKYYFGARYFDPFFGMWMSPDPAGQFANPYTYGGDPVNFVDPNGEFAFASVLIGAAIGTLVSGVTAYANCSGKDGCVGEAFKMALVGGTAGAAGSAVGEVFFGVSASAAGASGLSAAASSGTAAGAAGTSAAFAGGAVNGAISGFASSAVTYSLTTDSWNFGHFTIASLFGAFWGGLIGGLTDMFRYELSAEFQWETYKKVYNYGKKIGNLQGVADYIANLEGLVPGSVKVLEDEFVVLLDFDKNGKQWLRLGEGGTDDLGNIEIARSATKSASNFYETVSHEGIHQRFEYDKQSRIKMFDFSKNAEEAYVRDQLLGHKFSKYWSDERKMQIKAIGKYLKGEDRKKVNRTLKTFGTNTEFYKEYLLY